MKLYWEERKSGQRLILFGDDETETEVGAVRSTPRGFDALAKTNTYDPGRAQKGFATIEEAKVFVEAFHPWDLFGGDLDMDVEPEVRRLPGETPTPSASEASQASQATEPASASIPAEDESGETAGSAEPVTPSPGESGEPDMEEKQPRKGGWQFWEKG